MSPHLSQGLAGARRSVIGDSPQLLTHYYDDARTMYEVFRRGFSISGESTVVRRSRTRRGEVGTKPCRCSYSMVNGIVTEPSHLRDITSHFQKAMMALPCSTIVISMSAVHGVLPHWMQQCHGQIIIFGTIKNPSRSAHILPHKTGVNEELGSCIEEWIPASRYH